LTTGRRVRDDAPMRPRGTGSLRLVDGIYHARYYSHGRRHHESTKTGDRDKAEAWLRKRVKLADLPQYVAPDARKVRFEKLADLIRLDYARKGNKSRVEYRLKHLADAFGGWPALRITTTAVEQYADERRKAGAAVATVNRDLAVLRRAFRLAVQKNVLPSMPTITTTSEVGNERGGFIDPPDFDALLGELRRRDAVVADIAEAAYYTCLRRGNVLALAWSMCSLDLDEGRRVVGGTLRLPGTITKNKKPLMLPLAGRLLDLVARRYALRDPQTDRVFHRDGVPVRRFHATWHDAVAAVGRTGLILHDLRRSGARTLRRAGIAEDVIMKLGGWRTRSMFSRYNIVDESDLAAAQERMTEAFAAPGPRTVVPLRTRGR
jgi:site-specific recombinase XerD